MLALMADCVSDGQLPLLSCVFCCLSRCKDPLQLVWETPDLLLHKHQHPVWGTAFDDMHSGPAPASV